MPFPKSIQLIQPGEPVIAGVPNRPLQTLDERTQYLLALLDQASLGSTIIAPQVAVDPALNVGQPVYYNASHNRFEAGLSTATTDLTGHPVAAASSHVWGVILTKYANGAADVLLNGYAAIDITAALEPGQSLAAGLYYLSRSTPGALTQVRPPVAMPVLRADGEGNVCVNPAWEDPLTNHVHSYSLLRAAPAGTHTYPGNGNPHVITNPDISVPGWLPAAHPVFNGKAPSRAVFGYNIKADSKLASVWPPVPASSAVLLKDGIQVQDGDTGLVILDDNGIWWTENAIGYVPFPDHIHTDDAIISEWSQPSETLPDRYEYQMQLKLYFTRPTFLSDQTAVTSLTTNDKRIKLTCANNEALGASAGPIDISLDLEFMLNRNATVGWNVPKNYNSLTQSFDCGSVCAGIYSLSNQITLTGQEVSTVYLDTVTGTEMPQSGPTTVTRTVYRGDVGIDVAAPVGRELFPDLVRLEGVEEEYIQNVMYLGFDAGKQQAIRARIQVPVTLDATSPMMTLVFRIIGLGAGTLPPMTLSYRRIPASSTPAALPLTDTTISLTTGQTLTAANQYLDISSSAFAVAAGDDVLFTLQRGASDSYIYQVGVMRQTGLIASA